jgi:tRNA threonylcarbamoyladenosine biosynthesis protein TsaB
MIILTLRTDKPEAEIGLYEDGQPLTYFTWEAHRQLAETLHAKLKAVLDSQKLTLDSVDGIVVYKGPGSFTGLRIGLSVANALADSLVTPIVATTGENWLENGVQAINDGKNEQIAVPEYGAPVHITQPRK